jgi:uncharacterized protein
MKLHSLIVGTFSLLLIAGTGCGASFDCDKAATPVEKLICSDAELSKLDESLSEAYRKALGSKDIREVMTESQRQWLTNVRNTCPDAECIRNACKRRIEELTCLAPSGRYELLKRFPTGVHDAMFEVDPGNMEICRAYERNLNSFPEIKQPMVCERPINPTFKEFKEFRWTDLNVSEHRDTILRMDKESLFWKAHPEMMSVSEWENRFKLRTSEGAIKLRSAEIKLPAIAAKPLNQPLYLLEYDCDRRCNPTSRRSLQHAGGYEYFITDREMKNLWKIAYDVTHPFVYKVDVYFTSFRHTDWSDWYKRRLKARQYEIWLHKLVRVPGEIAVVPICRFRYVGKVQVLPGTPD